MEACSGLLEGPRCMLRPHRLTVPSNSSGMGSGVELWASGICWKIRCECYKQAKREQIVPSGNPIDSVRWQSGRIGPDWKIEVTEFPITSVRVCTGIGWGSPDELVRTGRLKSHSHFETTFTFSGCLHAPCWKWGAKLAPLRIGPERHLAMGPYFWAADPPIYLVRAN